MRQPVIKKHQWEAIGGENRQQSTKGGLKSSLFYSYLDLYEVAGELKTLGKTGWYGKMCSQAARLDFMVEFQNVISHG